MRRHAARSVTRGRVARGRDVEAVERRTGDRVRDHQLMLAYGELEAKRSAVFGVVVKVVPVPNITDADAPLVPGALVDPEPKAIVLGAGRADAAPDDERCSARRRKLVDGARGAGHLVRARFGRSDIGGTRGFRVGLHTEFGAELTGLGFE